MSSFGSSVNPASGAIVPVNTAAFLPKLDDPTSALLHLTFTQFLSTKFGLFVGKVFTLDADANEFADDYRRKFLNMALDVNTVSAMFPVSAYGGGLVALPWPGAIFTVSVLDPSGTPTNNDISEAFRDGVMVGAEGRITIKPFGLVGHQLVGFGWSNKERLSLEQDPSNLARLFVASQFPRLADPGPVLLRILARFFPALLVPTQPVNRVENTWAVYYNFDQYLWSPKDDPSRGVGVFFRFGASDGVANPIKYTFNVGAGGKGVVPGRPFDTFGVGWSRVEFSDNFVPFLRKQLDLGLEREDAIEMYYNVSIARWLNATVDLQIVEPGLKKTLDSSGRLRDVSTAVIAGLRIDARF
jgi:porin